MKWGRSISIILIPTLFVLGLSKVSARSLTQEDIEQYIVDPIFNDLWFGLYGANGEKYGWWNGNEYRDGSWWIFEEKSEVWVLDEVEVDGHSYEENLIIGTHTREYFDIHRGFSLSKIESEIRFGNQNRRTMVDVINGTAQVRVEDGDRTFNFDVGGFSLSLRDIYALELLLRKYSDWKIGETIEYKHYDPDTFTLSTETDVIMEIGTSFRDGLPVGFYRVKTLPSASRASFEMFLTTKGVPLKYLEGDGYAVLLDEDEAKGNLSFGGATFQDSVVYLDQSLPDLNAVETIKFEIIGDYTGGIHSGYQQEVVVEEQRVYLVLGKDIGVRERASFHERQANLAQSINYPTEDKDILRMVKEAIGETTSDWEKVEKLVNYVDKFISDDFSSNSLSVFEIIEKRRGDCSEHSLLFNTMARAAGIPAREVRGLMNFEDKKFGLHAWNEVLVGGVWRSIDSTWNQVVPSITYIKFSENQKISEPIQFRLIEIK